MGVWSNAAKAVSNGFSKGMKGITNFFSKEAKAAGKAFAEETKTSAKAFASQEVKTAAKTAAGEAKAVAAEAGKSAQKAGKAFAGEAKAVGAEAGKSAKGAAKTVVEEAKVAGAEAKAGSKAATKAVGSAQKTAHGTQKAASESIQGVTGGNATGTVVSVEAGKGTKNAASAAVKGLTNGNGVMNNIERIGGWGGKVATWGAEHPLAALMYSSLAYKFFTGNKVQDLAVELFTDKNTPEHSKTPAGILKSSIFGEEPIVGFAVDSFLGRGTYDGMTERYRYIEQEGVDAYRAGKEGVRGIGGELLDGYNLAKNSVRSGVEYFRGNGLVDTNGIYTDPTAPNYPYGAAYQQSSVPTQEQAFVSKAREIAKNMTGRNVSLMDLGELGFGAWSLFSPQKMLVKLLGLGASAHAVSRINNRQSPQQVALAPSVQPLYGSIPFNDGVREEPVTVQRSR